MTRRAQHTQAAATSFLALFSIVGLALYGLPLYYDFMVQEFGWSRTQVTSGNALSKLVVGPLFGFLAGWIIDRFGPRRIMLVGILLAGGALIAAQAPINARLRVTLASPVGSGLVSFLVGIVILLGAVIVVGDGGEFETVRWSSHAKISAKMTG